MRTASSKPSLQPSKAVRRLDPNRRERQIVRILAILRQLGQGRTFTVHELAAEFRTRRETIYRDLRVLQDAGYPISGDDRGRLSRPRLLPSRVPEIRFSSAELDALLISVAQAQAALPTTESLGSAALKVRALAEAKPDLGASGLDEMFETWTYGSKDYAAHESRLALLIEGILRKRRCRVEYRAPSRSEPKSYDFDPYRLLFVGGGLYVVGVVPKHKHKGTATLAIDRLLSVGVSKNGFEVDPTFDPGKCRQDAFGVSWQDPVRCCPFAFEQIRRHMLGNAFGIPARNSPIFPMAVFSWRFVRVGFLKSAGGFWDGVMRLRSFRLRNCGMRY